MKYNFCTLFDTNYLARGLVLYDSIKKLNFDFHLYVFAFDNDCYFKLIKLNLVNCTVISLNDFEDDDMLKIKSQRTKAEYCWTSTPSTILYCINNFKLENCTYLDADLYFFNSPLIIFNEIDKASIALTKHNYTLKYEQSKTIGIYCVQFVYFNNDVNGMKALRWWRERCIEWCFARLENGKFGDQKYLDDWTERFENVYVIENSGVGLAPWNVQQFEILKNNKYLNKMKNTNQEFDIIFYHFHGLNFKINNNNIIVKPSKFELTKNVLTKLYVPYINYLLKAEIPDANKFNIVFSDHDFFTKIYNNLRLLLKKSEFFRKINSSLIKSSK
jgi:hypothetical protein